MARKKSKPQIWLEYIVARSVLGFFGTLPRSLSIKFGMLTAQLGHLVLGGLRRAGTRNLELAFPENSREENLSILKASFESLGRVLGETSQFPRFSRERLNELVEFDFAPEAYQRFKELRAAGRGAIIASPHLGNWEMGVFAYSALKEPINYLARPIDNPLIEEMTIKLRIRFGNRPINKTNSVSTAIELLRTGNILGVLPDVNVHPKEGVFVPFFGIPACTTSGVAMLAMRTNAIIVPMCCVWDETAQKYKLVHGEIIEPSRTGDRHRDVLETTASYTLAMEKFVRAYPEQWLWIHKRWKTRPPGEEELY
jgi:Kdo2-lipid IVA lauroyltransferase/acyltransferase